MIIPNAATKKTDEGGNKKGKLSEKGMISKHSTNAYSVEWLLDSRSTDHMIACRDLLHDIIHDNHSCIHIANGSSIKIAGHRSAHINNKITLHNVLHVLE